MKAILNTILSTVFIAILYSCGASADHFPAENEAKRDYEENRREDYDPPRDKGDIEEKAEKRIELNDEIKE